MGAPDSMIKKYPYINPQEITTFKVEAGDPLLAGVSYVTDKSGAVTGVQVSMGNWNQPKANYFNRALANWETAEWIAECPGGGEPLYSLVKFTAVDFQYAPAHNCVGGLAVSGDPSKAQIVNVETGGTPPAVLTSTKSGE
jgi:hypothetical protein